MNMNDLRYQKTEDSLKYTLLKLLKMKSLDRISITEICQEAHCSRNAFYQHYETKYALYEIMLKSLIEDIQISCQPIVGALEEVNEEKIREYTHNLLRGVHAHRYEITSLFSSDPAFYDLLRSSIYEVLCRNNMHFTGTQPDTMTNLYSAYIASGVCGFIEYWLLNTSMGLTEAQQQLDSFTQHNHFGLLGLLKAAACEN